MKARKSRQILTSEIEDRLDSLEFNYRSLNGWRDLLQDDFARTNEIMRIQSMRIDYLESRILDLTNLLTSAVDSTLLSQERSD